MVTTVVFLVVLSIILVLLGRTWFYQLGYLFVGAILVWTAFKGFVGTTHYLELTDSGEIELDQSGPGQLLPSSRISWFGCWLLIQTETENSKKTAVLFVYKDSVTQQEYARLCRFLLRFKFGRPQASKQSP